MWTWDVFQVQYYDQPRKTGDRIETPATLGRKCWAFAYLSSVWNPLALEKALTPANLTAMQFIMAYSKSIQPTMQLCVDVKDACFANCTRPCPKKHCPTDVLEFKAGFERENVQRGGKVHYPW